MKNFVTCVKIHLSRSGLFNNIYYYCLIILFPFSSIATIDPLNPEGEPIKVSPFISANVGPSTIILYSLLASVITIWPCTKASVKNSKLSSPVSGFVFGLGVPKALFPCITCSIDGKYLEPNSVEISSKT